MNSPFVTFVGSGISCIAVGGKIIRDKIRLVALNVCKDYIEPIVQKRIRIGLFTRLGSIEC